MHNVKLPCWQIAPWTIIIESNMVSVSSLFFLYCLVVRAKTTMRTVNPSNVKNVIIQTSNVNGRIDILRTLDSAGCLNKAAGLQIVVYGYIQYQKLQVFSCLYFEN